MQKVTVAAFGPVATAAAGLDFATLVREHQAMVYSLALHFLRDSALAEEIAQDVFWTLYRHLKQVASPEHVVFWLRRVTVQRSIDAARKRQRRPQVPLGAIAEPSVEPAPSDVLLTQAIQRLIAELSETPRAVMILRYQEDLDPSEIAPLLDLPLATVKSHLQRSLALLREKLEHSK